MELEYNLGKIRELINEALIPEDLENLLLDEFRRIYHNCYGQDRGFKIRSLVEYAERQGEIANLLRLVEGKNQKCYEKYRHHLYNSSDRQNSSQQRSQVYKSFPAVSDFDLRNTIDRCVQRIRGCRRGLIGLSVCCNHHLFVQNFRKRLDEELRYRNIKVCAPISVNHINTVKTVVATVDGLKKTLKLKNIVCLIKIDNSLNSKSVTTELWTEIQEVFVGVELDRSLTIVMFGDRDCIFPSDMLLLDPPRFTSIHAYNWIKAITTALGRQEEWIDVQDKWTAKITELCPCEDPDFLDMVSVYDQLDWIFSLLQDNPSISPQDFLAHLEE
jgi:hypothetical protein